MEWKDADAVKEAESELRRDSIQLLFENYYFNKLEVKAPHRSGRLSVNQTTSTKATTRTMQTTDNNDTLLKGQDDSDDD